MIMNLKTWLRNLSITWLKGIISWPMGIDWAISNSLLGLSNLLRVWVPMILMPSLLYIKSIHFLKLGGLIRFRAHRQFKKVGITSLLLLQPNWQNVAKIQRIVIRTSVSENIFEHANQIGRSTWHSRDYQKLHQEVLAQRKLSTWKSKKWLHQKFQKKNLNYNKFNLPYSKDQGQHQTLLQSQALKRKSP